MSSDGFLSRGKPVSSGNEIVNQAASLKPVNYTRVSGYAMYPQRRATVFALQDGGLSSSSFPRTFSTLYFLFSANCASRGKNADVTGRRKGKSFFFISSVVF